MCLKLKDGVYELGENGLPKKAGALEALLQNAAMRLVISKGSFIYDRELGSELYTLDVYGEHAAEQAMAFANEALMDMPGVTANRAEITESGNIEFTISTPQGEGKIIYESI